MGKQQTGKQTNIYNLLSRKHLVLDTVQTLFYLITTTSGVRYLGYMCVINFSSPTSEPPFHV